MYCLEICESLSCSAMQLIVVCHKPLVVLLAQLKQLIVMRYVTEFNGSYYIHYIDFLIEHG